MLFAGSNNLTYVRKINHKIEAITNDWTMAKRKFSLSKLSMKRVSGVPPYNSSFHFITATFKFHVIVCK